MTVAGSEQDLASGQLWSAGVLGIEERDDVLIATFADAEAASSASTLLGRRWPTRPIGSDDPADWAAARSRHRQAVRAGRFLLPAPGSIDPAGTGNAIDAVEGLIELSIDERDAFGHGGHPTTALLLEEIGTEIGAGDRVLDVGCGTGVLAIAAARLGAEVTAIDIAPEAVAATTHNAARNGVDIDISGTALAQVGGAYDVVLANMIRPELEPLIADLCRVTGRRLLLSGLLVDQELPGLTTETVATRNGWKLLSWRPGRM